MEEADSRRQTATAGGNEVSGMAGNPSMGASLPLFVGEVHLWYALLDQPDEPHWLARCQSVLSAEEAARQRRFHFEKDRRQFLLSHALLRFVLSVYHPAVSPAAWRFSAGTHGKPFLVEPLPSPLLSFNLTHTPGLAAVALALEHDIGVDAEYLERSNASLGLAERYFAPSESTRLRGLPPDQLREFFFDYWTLKEAYIKGRGLGLALPLDGFAFDLQPGRPPLISFTEKVADDPQAWQFVQFRPSKSYKIAVAIHCPASHHLATTLRRFEPEVELRSARIDGS
jgi:4'-phosphopantetheinyl transferase